MLRTLKAKSLRSINQYQLSRSINNGPPQLRNAKSNVTKYQTAHTRRPKFNRNEFEWDLVTKKQKEVKDIKNFNYNDKLLSLDFPLFKQKSEEYDAILKFIHIDDAKVYELVSANFINNNKSEKRINNDTVDLILDSNEVIKDIEEYNFNSDLLEYKPPSSNGQRIVDDSEPMITLENFRVGDLISFGVDLGIIFKIGNGDLYVINDKGNFFFSGHVNVQFHYPDFLNSEYCKQIIKSKNSEQIVKDLLEKDKVKEFFPLGSYLVYQFIQKACEIELTYHKQFSEKAKQYHQQQIETIHLSKLELDILERKAEPYELYGFFLYLSHQFDTFIIDKDKRNTFDLINKQHQLIFNQLELNLKQKDKFNLFMDKCAILINYRKNHFNLNNIKDFNNPLFPSFGKDQGENLAMDWINNRKLNVINDKQLLPKFNSFDTDIIKGIFNYALIDKINSKHFISNSISNILKPLGYNYTNCSFALDFLKDIGIIDPYLDPNLFHYKLKLNQLNLLNESKYPTSFDDINDPYSAIRKDMTNHTIYTIDDKEAKEIDDGVSIEIKEDNSKWLHIHIADPTTLMQPNDEIILNNLKILPESIYLPDKSISMLPKSITNGPCSLGGNLNENKYALTFSIKINEINGQIEEYEINPTIIKNIIKINYDDIDKIINNQLQINQNMKQEILQIKNLILNNLNYNVNNGRLIIDRTNFEITVNKKQDNGLRQQSNYDNFNDNIQFKLNLFKHDINSSRFIISNAMNLAGIIATLYMKKYNLPGLYIIQNDPDYKSEPIKGNILKSIVDKKLVLSESTYLYLRSIIKPNVLSFKPDKNFSMGLEDGYCKITSPLRRFNDLLLHWQIKYHLLNNKILFNQHQLQSIYKDYSVNLYHINKLKQRSNKFWIINYILKNENYIRKYQEIPKDIPDNLIHGIHYPRLDHINFAKGIYKGKLIKYNKETDIWMVNVLPFNWLAVFKKNLNKENELDRKFQVGDTLDMVILSATKDTNHLLFMGLEN